MIDQARALAGRSGLSNVTWRVGPVLPLDYPDGAFSIATSRFAFHHLQEPGAVLAEMKRVCVPGGTVMLVDAAASPDPVVAARFNRMERLRDPSHVRALTVAEMRTLFAAAGLTGVRETSYRLEGELKGLLERSFPVAGGADEIRRMFAASLEGEDLGLATRREGDQIRFGYPVAVLAARLPDRG
jgi:SAM-dependent methyltransferase